MIDRRVPIALILAIFTQMAGMLVWAASLEARVRNVETQTTSASGYGEKLARIEERLDYMKQDTVTIKRQLVYLTDKLIGK